MIVRYSHWASCWMPRRSQVFAGNVSEPHTLAEMLSALQAPNLVVMDRGIQDNITWLAAQGYRYLVVSKRNLASAMTVTTATQQTVHLRCCPKMRPVCIAIPRRGNKRRRPLLSASPSALRMPCSQKDCQDPVHKNASIKSQIGRLKEKSHGVAQHYDIDVTSSEDGTQALAINWRRQPVNGSMLTHPGVYCLRSNQTDWDEETLWRTYITLTDLEAVFRSLKSELGLRPIYHHKALRTEGHLFITVIAYQLVQVIRRRLRQHGQSESWSLLRRILNGQQRITATFRRADHACP